MPADRGLAGRVLALTGGQDLAEDDLVDLLASTGALQRRLDDAAPSSCAGVLANAPLNCQCSSCAA
jgi:hypothetical protein